MFMNGLLNNDVKEGTFVTVPARLQIPENTRTINRRVVQQIIIDLAEIMAIFNFQKWMKLS
jgi:hypothetical protein